MSPTGGSTPSPLRAALQADLRAAMADRDSASVAVLRTTIAALANAEAVDAAGVQAGNGVGATEARRRSLTAADERLVLERERQELAEALEAMADLGDEARVAMLRHQVAVLDRLLAEVAPDPS